MHTSTYGVPTTWCVPSCLYSFCALSIKAVACLMMMWVKYSRTQMMTRKIMRHKVTYTGKVHGQVGASKCLDEVLSALNGLVTQVFNA